MHPINKRDVKHALILAKKYQNKGNYGSWRNDDFLSAAFWGLLVASRTFKEDSKYPWNLWAHWAIRDALNKQFKQIKRLKRGEAKHHLVLGEPSKEEEIGSVIDVGIPAYEPDPFVKRAIDNLPERQRDILIKTFDGEATNTEIAKARGVSQQRISDLRIAALHAIRHELYLDGEEEPVNKIGNRALRDEQVRQIRQMAAKGEMSHRQLAIRFEVSRSTIGAIVHMQSYKDVGT